MRTPSIVKSNEFSKSQATIPFAWFRRNVAQRGSVPPPPGRFLAKYLLTLRGETRMPSLSFQFVSNPFLAPGWIVVCHLPNQFAQVLWQSRSASLSRLPSPEPPERSAMPLKKCLRLDNDQSITPIEEPGEQDPERPRGSGGTSRLDLAFLKQSELFAKEQILGKDCSVGRKEQPDKRKQLQILQELPASSNEARIYLLRSTACIRPAASTIRG
jgi:hypothetical protein